MATTRTAITCPEHFSCVCVFVSVPEEDLNGRKPLHLSDPYYFWVVENDPVLAVEHHDAPPGPQGMVIAEVAVQPTIRQEIADIEDAVRADLGDLRMHIREVDEEHIDRFAEQAKRLDELEAFVTRRQGWKRAWDKRGEVEPNG